MVEVVDVDDGAVVAVVLVVVLDEVVDPSVVEVDPGAVDVDVVDSATVPGPDGVGPSVVVVVGPVVEVEDDEPGTPVSKVATG